MGTLGGWCEGDVCKNVTHGQCCENYAKTYGCLLFAYFKNIYTLLFFFPLHREYQCYDQSKFFCCKVGEAGKGSHSKVNETGPLVCSNSEQKCCVWNVTSSTPGHNETFYFLKKCCKYCCSDIPGECDSNCTSTT